jgi:hypothetical protein
LRAFRKIQKSIFLHFKGSEAKRDAVKRVLEAATLEEVLPTAANSMKVAFRILSLQAGLVFILKE